MSRAFLFLLFSLLLGNSLFAQESENRDSLFQIWYDVALPDSNRLRALYLLADYYYYTQFNPDSLHSYYQRLYDFAKEVNNLPYMGTARHNQGITFNKQGAYHKGKPYFEDALRIRTQIGDKNGMAKTYNSLGNYYRRANKTEEALFHFQQARKLFLETGDSLLSGAVMLNEADILGGQGKYEQAIAQGLKCLDLFQRAKNIRYEASTHFNLGVYHANLGDYPQAIEQYEWIRTNHVQVQNLGLLLKVMNGLSSISTVLGDSTTAIKYIQEVLSISDSLGLYNEMVSAYTTLAELNSGGDQEQALAYLNEALEIANEKKQLNRIPYLELVKGKLLLRLQRWEEAEEILTKTLKQLTSDKNTNPGYLASNYLYLSALKQELGDYQEARKYAELGYPIAVKSGRLEQQKQLASNLYILYKQEGKIAQALEMLEAEVALSYRLSNEESNRELLRQEYQYTYQQQAYQDSIQNAQELALQAAETEKRTAISYFLMGGLGLTLLFGLLLFNRFRLTNKQKKIIEEEKGKLDLAYSELNQANEKLKEMDQVKSRFFTNISHEFRTPLTVIGGMLEQVQADPQRWLDKGGELIKRNVNNLLHLINQILDLRKLESGNLSLALIQDEVVSFLRTHTESLRSMAENKEVELAFHTDLAEQFMDFDPDKLLLIQSNLISNAIKFTKPGGRVDVSVSKTEDERLLFLVKDTGIGIPKEQLPLIFDRFYQADHEQAQVGEGTGIGLSLSRELVHLMKGHIQVESNQGEGSAFQVSLPITQDIPLKKAAATTPIPIPMLPTFPTSSQDEPPSPDGELPTLLIIEDNPDVGAYISACLEDSYQLFIARDGEEGIAVALEHIPDLIISDVMMPKKNGYEVCHILKSDERTSHIPIVLLTAKADRDSRLEGLGKGADAYLTKPFDQEELFIRLEQLLALRKRLQSRYEHSSSAPPPEESEFQLEDAFILKIRNAILARLDESSYRPEDLCRDLGVSRTQLFKKTKALTGKSTSHFIRSIRLEKAKELLLTTDLQVTEVAYSVGFGDPHYFSRVFTKELGSSPTAWREAQKS